MDIKRAEKSEEMVLFMIMINFPLNYQSCPSTSSPLDFTTCIFRTKAFTPVLPIQTEVYFQCLWCPDIEQSSNLTVYVKFIGY